MPLQYEYFAQESIVKLLQTCELIKKRLRTGLNLLGVTLTMNDVRNKLERQEKNEVRKAFSDNL